MHTSKKKNDLLRGRMKSFYCDVGITTHDIVPITNEGWKNSFARVRTNRKAYCERGWYPYNRNLLLCNQIRSKMTKESREVEARSGWYPYNRIEKESNDKLLNNQGSITMSIEHSHTMAQTVQLEHIQASEGTFSGSCVAV